jgi:ABC-type antimicrobial peptide transport system permease subunit
VVGLTWVSALVSRVRLFELMIDRWQLAPGLLDPAVLAVALGSVLTMVLSVALLTARRALRVDPVVALRSQ